MFSIFKNYKLYTVALLLMALAVSVQAQSRKSKKKAETGDSKTEILNTDGARQSEYYLIEADKYFILEDYAKAFVLFQKALEQDPKNATAYYKIAEIYEKSEDYDKALASALKAKELDNTNKYFYVLLAEIYSKKSDYGAAIATYQEMFANCEKANEYLFELAALYIFDEQYSKAIEVYNKVEEVFGINDQVINQKQKLYIQMNDLAGAIKEGEKLMEAFPGEVEYVISLAEILLSNGKNEQAKKYLEEYLVEYEGNEPRTKLLLSSIYRNDGERERSEKYLADAIANPQLDYTTKLRVINNYIQQLPNKDVELLCIELSEKLIESHPGEPDSYAVAGDIYMELDNSEKAIEMYDKALEKGAENYNVWHNVIRLSYLKENYAAVVKYSEEAIELYPNQVFLFFFLGSAHLVKKQYEEAVEALEMAKKLSGKNDELKSTINAQLGDAYNYIKDHKNSDASYEEALAYNPNNDHVLNNYSYFLSLRKEKLDMALKMSSKLVKRNPDNPTFLDTHAWVLYMHGNYKEARLYIEKAIKVGDASGTIIEHYGDILFKLGEVDSAVKQWQIAKGMDEKSDLIDKKIADRKLYE